MTKQETIQVLQSIEDRAVDFPNMTECDWVAITSAKRKLNPNTAWNSENVIPKYNLNGITDFIISSAYGHIEGEAHTYTPEQWNAHLGFNAYRDFRWAYEKDLIDFD
jgi:hypothetical protein